MHFLVVLQVCDSLIIKINVIKMLSFFGGNGNISLPGTNARVATI